MVVVDSRLSVGSSLPDVRGGWAALEFELEAAPAPICAATIGSGGKDLLLLEERGMVGWRGVSLICPSGEEREGEGCG